MLGNSADQNLLWSGVWCEIELSYLYAEICYAQRADMFCTRLAQQTVVAAGRSLL